MPRDIFEQFELAKKRKLTDAEMLWFERGREQLRIHIQKTKIKPLAKPIAANSNIWRHLSLWQAAVATAILVVVMTSGISYAARESIPGDALYAWKINVNERAGSLLNTSDNAKTNYAVDLAAERLREAAELSIRSNVEATVRQSATTTLVGQLDRAESAITQLETKNVNHALAASVKLRAALAAHKEVLIKLESTMNDGSREQVKDAIAAITKTSENLQNKSPELANKAIQTIAAQSDEEQKKAVSTALNEAAIALQKTISDVKNTQDGELLEHATDQLEQADRLLAQAQDSLAQGDYATAYTQIKSITALTSNAEALVLVQEQASETLKDKLDVVETPNITPSVNNPIIKQIEPVSGVVGNKITVSGSGFNSNTRIIFGSGLITEVTVKDPGILVFTVPTTLTPACRWSVPACSIPSTQTKPGTYTISATTNGTTSNELLFAVTAGGVIAPIPTTIATTSPVATPIPKASINLSAASTVVVAPTPITFTATVSNIATCDTPLTWDFGDGSILITNACSNQVSPNLGHTVYASHVYEHKGRYTVTVTGSGASSNAVTVTVNEILN